MLLEKFDTQEYANSLFVLGSHIFQPVDYFRAEFPGKKIIAYQMEQVVPIDIARKGVKHGWHSQDMLIKNISGYDEIWDIDELNRDALASYGIHVNKIAHLPYTKCLDKIESVDNPKIDILFYGFVNVRRANILFNLQSYFYNKLCLVWIYGAHDIDEYLANCKVVLNIHAFAPHNRQEQVRMFYPVINGKCVVSEPSAANRMSGLIIEVPTNSLADELLRICKSDAWREFGKTAKNRFMAADPFTP